MAGFLLDTNVVSELTKRAPNPKVQAWIDSIDESVLYLSVLTIGEIRKGLSLLPRSARRTRYEAWLETDLRPRFAGRLLSIDVGLAERWGVLTARAAKAHGRVPVIDGLLAATAAHHNLTFATRNANDVAYTGVPVFNPWSD